MKKRLLTSAVIVLVLALAFLSRMLTYYVFDFVILALAVMGVVEIARVLERQKKYSNILVCGTFPAMLYLIALLVIKKNWGWQYIVTGIFIAMIFYFLLIFLLTFFMKKTTKAEMEKYQIAEVKPVSYAFDKAIYSLSVFVYPGLLFMTLILINHFSELSFISTPEMAFTKLSTFILLFVFVVTMCTDSLAMITGSTLKGPKLCPLISPNKTVSGAIGGLVGGVGSGMILYAIFNTSTRFKLEFSAVNGSFWIVALIALLGSVVSQMGDIFASALKRKARVKDYGTIFPGHGGVMDRVDGLVFNSLLCFVAFTLLVVLA